MFKFPKKKKETAADAGKQFLTDAKAQHGELFAAFAENVETYDSVEEFLSALESQSWELLELICKASYRNGIARGQRRQKSAAR
jgi:beta-phosphoglucomutase-like phosphatase (HAD superfamily)